MGFKSPLDCNIDDVPVKLQLDLIDLQENDLLKEKHREGNMLNFITADDKLKKFVSGMTSVYGTTYICEHFIFTEVSEMSMSNDVD